LAEQAKILREEAEEDNLGTKVQNERWDRWETCGLCKQDYHGVVSCALGWACWKTYLDRPEADPTRLDAMNILGNGLAAVDHHEDELSVREVELSMLRRLGDTESNMLAMLAVQGNLANVYHMLGRPEALRMRQDVYYGTLKLMGKEHNDTLVEAVCYAIGLNESRRFEEAKSLMRKTLPVAQRVVGENCDLTLRMRESYARALFLDTGATLEDLRKAVTTLEETARTARRVLGGAHPIVVGIDDSLRVSRAALRARETPSASPGVEAAART